MLLHWVRGGGSRGWYGCSIELLIPMKSHGFCRWLGSWVLQVGEREKKGKEVRVKEKREENVTRFRHLGTN